MTRAEMMRAYKAEGHTAKEVAVKFNVSCDWARQICKGVAPQLNKNSESDVARKIKEKSNGFLEYVSGYTIKEKPVKVRCVVCGGEFERTFHNLTTKGGVTCPHCVKAESEKNKQVKALNKTIQEQKKKAERLSRSQLISMRVCVECGELFIPKSKSNIRCSSACTRRAFNRNADARLNENNVVDKDITLTKLYKRDKGVCYLCGRKCNWNDYVTRSNGVVVAGDSYPSVEHVIPLSKGGLHSWNNVMLACRGCNTKKNAKILEA